jgi:DNA invertase Pin-like site-specific DNA recombinase
MMVAINPRSRAPRPGRRRKAVRTAGRVHGDHGPRASESCLHPSLSAFPGARHHQAKLVREAYDRRDCTVAEIAADFGVTRQTVYRALKKTETGAAPRV